MPAAAGHIASARSQVRQHQMRQAAGDGAHGRDARRLAGRAAPEAAIASADGDERRGRARREVLERRPAAPAARRPAAASAIEVSGNCCARASRSRKKPAFSKWTPSSFGSWSTTITSADARLEAGEHRVGDEVGDEARGAAATPSAEQDADQHRQRRRGGDQLGRVAAGRRTSELRRRQDRDGRRRADAERARGPEQRIDHHRHDGGVQPDLQRQSARWSRTPSPSARPPRRRSGRR